MMAEQLIAGFAAGALADLRPLLDSLPDPVLLVDAGSRVTLLNTAGATFLQLASEVIVGQDLVSVTTDQSLLELFDAAREVGAARATHREVKVVRAGSRMTFQGLALLNVDGSVLLLLRDITRLMEAVQMKTDFVSNAGHELRTPVAAMKLALETLREEAEDAYTRGRCITILAGQLARVEEMLTDLMDLSKLESPELQTQVRTIRPSELFEGLAAGLMPIARGKGLSLGFEGPEDDGPLSTDPRMLSLVLKNLIENAVKFTSTGGVRVRVERRGPTGFTVSVTDTGAGIPEEHHARVFERFYQVDPARSGSSARGTGLGLSIVKHAVQRLGGAVSLESAVGRGTTVRCEF